MLIVDGAVIHPNWLELGRYLGGDMNWKWCNAKDEKADEDARRFSSNDEFMEKTDVFCYSNIGLMIQGIHRPYFSLILNMAADYGRATLIDVGAGGGQIGLAFHELGFYVSWADIESRSNAWLLWRLAQRGIDRPVFVLTPETKAIIPRHTVAVCFDVFEHIPQDVQIELLNDLSRWGDFVYLNLIRDNRESTRRIHTSVDFDFVCDYVTQRWPGFWQDHYPDENGQARQRLVVYGEGLKEPRKNG